MKKTLLILLSFCFLLAVQAARPPKTHVAKKKKPSIVGGFNVPSASLVPYQILMTTSDDGGGSIISKRWILTAAHLNTNTGNDPNTNTKLYAGVVSRNNLNTPFTIAQRIPFPTFTGYNHDLALIKVDRDFNYASGIAPVKLASSSNSSLWNVGQSPRVTGFGKTSNTSALSSELKYVDVSVTSLDLTNNKILAGNNSFDSCHGDSGGPMVSNNIQIVTVNLGGNCGGGGGLGGAYMMVSPYLAWIISTLHLEGTPDFVCGNTTFENIDIMPDGTSFEWTASPVSLFSVSAGTGLTFTTAQAPNNSGVGSIILKAKDASGNIIVTVTKQVWVGTPKINLVTDGTFSINGQFANICKGFGYCMTANSDVPLTNVTSMQPQPTKNLSSVINTARTVNSYSNCNLLNQNSYYCSWPSYNSSSSTSTQYLPNDKVCFATNSTGTFYQTIYAYNTCGSNSRSVAFQVNNCSYRIYPNPAQTTMAIAFDTPEKSESIPDLIEIKAEKTGQTVKAKEMKGFKDNAKNDIKALAKLDVDVSDLPRGTYYVHLTFGTNKEQRVEKVRIILTN